MAKIIRGAASLDKSTTTVCLQERCCCKNLGSSAQIAHYLNLRFFSGKKTTIYSMQMKVALCVCALQADIVMYFNLESGRRSLTGFHWL